MKWCFQVFARRRCWTLAAGCLLLGGGLGSGAAQNLRYLSQQVWSTEQGLPQSSVHSVLQTPDGYLWIATEGGLVRFDGVAFQIYGPGDQKAFASADICCLAVDREGLWIGTADGLVRLQQGRFRRFGKADGLGSAMIEALRPSKDGALVVETSGGWARWEKTGFARLAEAPEALLPDSQGLTAVAGSALWRASATTVAVTGDGAGKEREWSVGEQLPMGRIQTVSVDRSGLAWVGMNRGLFVLRADQAAAIPVELLSGNSVLSIFEDAERNHWIGTETSGLHVLRRLAFRSEPALADKAVTSVVETRDGSMWVGTRDDGLRRIRDGVVDQPVAATKLTSAVVLCLAPGVRGGLWVGTPDGLDYLDESKGVSRITSGDGLPDDDVRALAGDGDGSVWVGTRQGLAHVRRAGTKWSIETLTSANGLGGDMVGSLLLTRDALWAGTSGGLSRVSRDGKIRNFTTQDGLGGLITTAMGQDRAGDLWVASQGGSLSLFDGQRFLRVSGVQEPGSHGGNIVGITADGLGFLWLRMDRGIRRVSLAALHACVGKPACTSVNGASRSVANYGLAEGLPNDEVVAGEPSVGWLARDGEIWFPTRGGVAIVDTLHLPIDTVPPPVVIQRFVVDGTSESVEPTGATGAAEIDLPFGHARFTMEYAGLSFTAPLEVRYRFRLSGFDKDWTDAGNRRSASYTNLPPGRYVFQVQAANNDGVWNRAGAELRFRIVPPYYRRWWFVSLALLLLLALLAGMYLLRLRRLRGQFDAVLAERNRMAREIHDTLTQDFVGTSLQLDLISQQLSRGKVDAAMEQVKRTRQLVTEGLEEARRSIWELRVNRSQDSLPTRLTTLAQREMLGPVAPRLRLSGAYRPLEPRVEREILRIAQEALSNVLRHARATETAVDLHYSSDTLMLTIEDNGAGFVVDAVGHQAGHYGLLGMNERAAVIDGQLEIVSPAWAGNSRDAARAFDFEYEVEMGERIRIMLVEDHQVVRQGLVALLSDTDDLEVVGSVGDGPEAVETFRKVRPDVTLMDLQLPRLGGVETIRRIRGEFPQARFIVLTTFDGDEDIYRALQAGARAYLLKGMPLEELLTTIHAVHSGRLHIPPAVAEKLAERVGGQELTAREMSVLERIVAGRANKEISADLCISEATVKTHINSLLGKLGVADRTHAATVAIQRGLVSHR